MSGKKDKKDKKGKSKSGRMSDDSSKRDSQTSRDSSHATRMERVIRESFEGPKRESFETPAPPGPTPVPSEIVMANPNAFPEWPGNHSDLLSPVESKKSAEASSTKKPSVDDYDFGKSIGKGAYGDVVLATHKSSGKIYAAKKIEKKLLVKEDKTKYAVMEREILTKCDHPNIIKLVQSFRDPHYLYYVMELAPNGTLQSLLKQYGALNAECAAFIAAEIVSALEYLHMQQHIIHRDLKPENILFSSTNHVKVTDFGTSKQLGSDRNVRSDSFVGTAEYISPELVDVNERTAYLSSDLWALGCILYKMITGKFAFRGATDLVTFELIQAGKLHFPSNIPASAKDLIEKLLIKDPSQRLGANSFEELKAHPFFSNIDWNTLATTTPPKFGPSDLSLEWSDEKAEGASEAHPCSDPSCSTGEWTAETAQKCFKAFLKKGEKVVFASAVDKTFEGHENKKRHRVMVLTDKRRILYFNASLQPKGELALAAEKDIQVTCDGETFSVKLSRKSYQFSCPCAKDWEKVLGKL